MRLFIFALVVMVPTSASAQSALELLNACPNANELMKAGKTAGSGPEALENAVKFYLSPYGNPQSKSRGGDEITLTWVVPQAQGQSKTLTRTITLTLGREVAGSCNVSRK